MGARMLAGKLRVILSSKQARCLGRRRHFVVAFCDDSLQVSSRRIPLPAPTFPPGACCQRSCVPAYGHGARGQSQQMGRDCTTLQRPELARAARSTRLLSARPNVEPARAARRVRDDRSRKPTSVPTSMRSAVCQDCMVSRKA